jgi:putative phosphoribosyl transferase
MATVEDVWIDAAEVRLAGRLGLPDAAQGVVVFAHGSGSSRHSPRNRSVAGVLEEAGFATVLFDLLTESEESVRANVFDIPLLGSRLVAADAWVTGEPRLAGLPLAYFGASTGAAAALWASVEPDAHPFAVVSRGGRPDLAGSRLTSVTAPTLLIVGGLDRVVLGLNQNAAVLMAGEKRIVVVPGASHLFEEPGALQQVAKLACDWFVEHLPA